MKYKTKTEKVDAFRLCMDEAPQWFLTNEHIIAVPKNSEDEICMISHATHVETARKGDWIIKRSLDKDVLYEASEAKELETPFVLSNEEFKKLYVKTADDDPDKKWCMSLRKAVQAVMGTLYAQSPYHIPRKADIICQKFQDAFKKDAKLYQDFYFYEMKDKDVYGFFEKLLKDIPEFVELNLSKVEYEKGIKVDDPSRPPFGCVSRDSWIKEEHDFVDLDAAVRNVVRLYFQVEDDEREFLL